MGVSTDQLARYMRGENEPAVSKLAALSRASGFALEWLASGNGPQKPGDYASGTSTVLTAGDGSPRRLSAEQLRALIYVPLLGEINGNDKPDRTRGYVVGDYVYVPMFDVKAGAGRGKLPIGQRIIAWPVFMLAFVRDKLGAQPENLCMITVDGDSMEPELLNGSAVLVDLSDNSARRDGTYVIRVGDAVLVKNLQRIPGGFIKVSTTNPSSRFEPFNLHERGMEEQQAAIIGRVVWADRVF